MKKLIFMVFLMSSNCYAITTVLRPNKFTVTDYNGCVQNGVVNCSTAIKTAIALSTTSLSGSGNIHFPSGTYSLGSQIVMYSSVTFICDGPGSCILKAANNLNQKMIVNQAWGGSGTDTNIHLNGFIVDENGANQSISADTTVTFARLDNSSIENNSFINGVSGLFLLTGSTYDDNHHFRSRNNTFDATHLSTGGTDITDWGNGKDITEDWDVYLGGYSSSGNPQVSAAGMDNFVMTNCYLDGKNNAVPISIFGVHGGGIYNSEILNSNAQGIKLSYFQEGNPKRSLTDFKVMNNHIHNSGDNNIWVRQEFSSTDVVKNITISGNTLDHAPKSQIAIEIGNGFTISNNVMYDGSTSSSGTYAVINATGVAGTTDIYNLNVFGNHYFDDATTPSQTLLYKTNYVSTFTSNGNIAENITTRGSVSNTNNFLDFDSSGTSGLTPSKAMVTTSSGTYGTSGVTATELSYVVGATATIQTQLNSRGDMSYTNSRYFVGTFTRDVSSASGSVGYTGVGFSPKAVIFLSFIPAGTSFATGLDNSSTHEAMSVAALTSLDSWSSESIVYENAAGTASQVGHISSLDSDGFTISYTKTGSPTGTMRVFYMAFR